MGENTIRIRVSKADNAVLDTYTVTVTRVVPVVSIASTTTSVAEGDPVVFMVHRDVASSESLLVEVSLLKLARWFTMRYRAKGAGQ